MAGPIVELFSTSILSNVKVRTRHERYTSVLAIKKIPYVYHDLASDDDAKSRWRRKAKDPQLPGILVNNEWVGSYDEFEEAVEFGELELFLGVSPAAAQATPPAPHPAQQAVSSKDPSLYPTLPYAAEGAGRWKEPDADQFISSLNIKEEELNDADVDALLADIGKLPSEPSSSSEKKYVPSKEAAIKPLRLAKMGPQTSHQRMPSGSPSPSGSAGTRASPVARYSATQRSTRALAAEAAALTSNRKTSGALLREAVSQGKTLDDAMEESRMKHIVSQDNIDDLFASLGLSNIDIGDNEVDQFLEQGAIPQGLRLGGERVQRPSTAADKARDEAVARDLALKAKQKGHGSARSSLAHESTSKLVALAGLAPASQIGTSDGDASVDSSTTPSSSAQPSKVTEASSEAPETKQDETVKAVEPVKEQATAQGETSKGSDVVAAEEEAASSKIVGDDLVESAKSGDKEEKSNQEDGTKTKQEDDTLGDTSVVAMEAETTKADVADTEAVEEEKPVTSKVAEQTAIEGDEAIAKEQDEPDVATAISLPSTSETSSDSKLASSVSSKSLDTSDAKNTVPSPAEPDVLATSESLTASKDASLSSSGSQNLDKAEIDEDRAPTKEISADPIKLEGESIATTTEKPAQETEKKEDNDDFELELAHAAMIASRYENRKSGLPLQLDASAASADDKQEEAVQPSSSTSSSLLSKSAKVTSPAKSPPAAAVTSPVRIPAREGSKEGNSTSPLHLGVGAKGQGQPPSRQVSSGSVSSSRRAIDVSRPIDPTILPTSPLPPSSSSDLSMSPETLAKKKRGGLFGLGKDKDKDKSKEKERAATSDKASKTASVAAPPSSSSRHERTISQILREADAVLQMEEDGSDDEDETEDPSMFGSASVDI